MSPLKHQKAVVAREDPKWRGYTLDELRYQQAYALARIEIEKDRLRSMTRSLTANYNRVSHDTLLGRILNNFSYLDYGFLAFRLVRNVWRLFHRRRK
ncbi:MAG: hypothetical protein LIO90_02745 [Bacteroidales bacterium]|nr:hypothetical protein [Bacteroidales bacterium]